ncbi:hypothetical protein PTSG_10350, partial [Salpingoeca rosetta]
MQTPRQLLAQPSILLPSTRDAGLGQLGKTSENGTPSKFATGRWGRFQQRNCLALFAPPDTSQFSVTFDSRKTLPTTTSVARSRQPAPPTDLTFALASRPAPTATTLDSAHPAPAWFPVTMDKSMISSTTPGCATMYPSISSAAGQANVATTPARQASRSSSSSRSRVVVVGSNPTSIPSSAVDPSMEPGAQATMFAPASDRSSPGLGDDGASPVLSLPTFSSLPPLTLSNVPSPTSFTDLSLDLWSPQGPSAQQSLPLDAALVTSLLDDNKLFDLPPITGSDDDD